MAEPEHVYELSGFLDLCRAPGGLCNNLTEGDRIKVPGNTCSYVSGLLWENGVDYVITRPLRSPGLISYEIIDPKPKPRP
jgi:hypothetical protein